MDSETSLSELVAALDGVQQVAIDAERASGFRYSQRAYLIQIAVRDLGIWLVDPVADLDLTDLIAPLNSKTWLLHAATQDLPCLAELGFKPAGLIDTELTARIVGLERVGLGSVCESLLEIELAKEHSAADWSQRPLTQEMLDYAALDVDVMFELWEKLSELAHETDKEAWLAEEFEHLLDFKPKPALEEPWRGLPGISRIKDLAKLKIAASLHATRDAIAIEKDIAPGRLIPDRSIMAAVNQAPKSRSDLANNKEFQGRASRTLLSTWWEAIAKAQELEISLEPAEKGNGIPNHKSWERRFPEAHHRLEVVRPLVLAMAAELKIPVENLLTPDYLRRVCFEPQQDVAKQLSEYGARKWQIDLVTEVIQKGLLDAAQPQSA
ncbi:MAG: HRDC domain-containing protein [Actinomycetota bacterium]|nr:HRDC domain-containing protein [Actinomycetota bacterium]